MRGHIAALVMVVLAGVAMCAKAGDLDSPAAPDNAGGAMYTLEDVYNRLDAETPGAKRTGVFTEPAAGPAVQVTR